MVWRMMPVMTIRTELISIAGWGCALWTRPVWFPRPRAWCPMSSSVPCSTWHKPKGVDTPRKSRRCSRGISSGKTCPEGLKFWKRICDLRPVEQPKGILWSPMCTTVGTSWVLIRLVRMFSRLCLERRSWRILYVACCILKSSKTCTWKIGSRIIKVRFFLLEPLMRAQ